MNKPAFIALSLLIVGFSACTDDPVVEDPTPFVTTPYEVVQYPTLPPNRFPNDNRPTEEGVLLGRMLFYDPILSGDSTQSCGSCHNLAFGFTDNGRDVSIGISGAEGSRNSMPIFNLMYHLEGFFWDGRAELLRHQALLPIQDPIEMDETIENLLIKLNASESYRELFKKAFNIDVIDEDHVALALEQFMLIVISGNSKFDQGSLIGFTNFTESERRGLEIFNKEATTNDMNNEGGDCFHCHGAPLFMARDFMNNGLDSFSLDPGLQGVTGDPRDRGKFKVPSLRNIELTAPYMHDGRFATLEEVIDFYLTGVHPNPNINAGMHALQETVHLSAQQKADLIAFLKTLTDQDFVNNEEYKNPFN